jgi:hypothetical protein
VDTYGSVVGRSFRVAQGESGRKTLAPVVFNLT